jgi:class 3 adenylate cyclase
MGNETQYVSNGEVSIAYQVTGDGPIDIVIVPGFVSHLELELSNPFFIDYLRGLTAFARVVRFDKRGTGLSDPVAGIPTLEDRMEDVRAVMDAAGVERAAVYGISEGGPMAALFAATYPERTTALILCGTFASGDLIKTAAEAQLLPVIDAWGEGRSAHLFAPSIADDANARRMIGTYERSAASPGMARALVRAFVDIDVRDILPTIQAPTMVLHREADSAVPVAAAHELVDLIPGAELVLLPGNDHLPYIGDRQRLVSAIEEFLTGAHHTHESDRILATVLFTDIVASTERAAQMGDAAWRALLESHDDVARGEVERHRGRVVKTLGDGMLATFDGPARAIRCAEALRDRLRPLGVEIRAGVHTGECEAIGDDLGGLAVHIGSRVASKAAAGEVLVSSTVKELVVGSGLSFEDAGEQELKGVPGSWRLYRVGEAGPAPAPLPSAADTMRPSDRAMVTLARRAPGAMRMLARLTVKERAATTE